MDNQIRVLSEIEAIRKNPSMYIGSVSEEGVHHLLVELVHNAIDESILGCATKIQVNIDGDVCEIEDNGRGISTALHATLNIPELQVALTRLHAGSKFDKIKGRFTAGLHGMGLSCVNALSSELTIAVKNKSGYYVQKYSKGVAISELAYIEKSDSTGTRIKFNPDNEIFKFFKQFDAERIQGFLEEMSFLNPNVEFIFKNAYKKTEIRFLSQKGLVGLLEIKTSNKKILFTKPLVVNFTTDNLQFDCVFNWTSENIFQITSYVNFVPTVSGGTHVMSFRKGLKNVIINLIKEYKLATWTGYEPELDEISEGVFAVISCKILHPHFEGQTKSRITNAEITQDIELKVFEQVTEFFKSNPKNFSAVFQRLIEIRNARASAKRVAERVLLQFGSKKIDEQVYKEQFGARSKNWHESAVWITHQELLTAHADHFDGGPDSVALDVCCGSGVVGASFKSKVKKVIGLDLTPEMVNLASARLDEVFQGNVYEIPFKENTFDLVCTREVLHLLPYPEKPVSEIFRVLKPGSQFIVGQILPFSEVDAAWVYRIFKKKQPLIFNVFQEEDFRKMLIDAGFIDIKMNEMNVWESIDVWINSYETTSLHRHEIRELYKNASTEIREAHPFKILPSGEIMDLWRWCIFSARKPAN